MTHNSDAVKQADISVDAGLTGWRHGAVWTYLVMLAASAAALFVSLMLSAETLQLARNPGVKLGCDVNAVVSCSTVAESWQAEFIKFAGLSFPNAFFGIAAESVFVTIAVIGLSKVVVPRWFALCTWLGGLAALAYAYWLFIQSMFVIRALCPWCLGLMFATTIQFMALSHATVSVQRMPAKSNGLRKYYRLNFDLMVDVVWFPISYLRVLRASIDQINVTSATRVAEPVSATVSSVTSTRTVPPRTVMSQ